MKLSRRIFINFLIVVITGGLLSTLAGFILISRSVKSEAFSRVHNDLKVAWRFIDEKIRDIEVVSRILANEIKPDLIVQELPDIMVIFSQGKSKSLVIDENGRKWEVDGSVFWSVLAKELGGKIDTSSGIIKLKTELIEKLGFKLSLENSSICNDGSILALYSVYRKDEHIVFGATILNENETLVISMQDLIFGRDYYDGKPLGTVTIFCNDKRVATTVIGEDGKPAIGTSVSEIVKKRVLEEGKSWLDRAFVVDEWYLSAYEPIVSPERQRIGILYVGLLEKKYVDIRNRTIMIFAGIVILMIGILVLTVFLLSSRIVKPLIKLVTMTGKISSGEFSMSINTDSGIKEINDLTENFNRMARAVERRQKLLIEQNLQLKQTTKEYQELLRFVTHELNNSIGSLLLNVSILLDGTVGDLQGDQREVAEQLLRDTERFRDMVRNYLNISRLERGKLVCKPEPINIKKFVVEPVVKRLDRRIKDERFELRWKWPEEYIVKADGELLDICYSNLIINAIKYGKDWIELTIEKKSDEKGIWYVLGVRNGGEPIPEEKIPLLFQKFSRLVKSSDGAGLGLYLVRKIVEQHGGKVWCSSEKDGTGFYMMLPG